MGIYLFTVPSSTQHTQNLRLMRRVLFAGILLAVVKFVAWYLTGSEALFSDALESTINIAAGTFTLLSLRYAGRPRDSDHPYGHGKVEYFAVGFEGGLVLLAGVGIGANALYAWLHPVPLQKLDVGILLGTVAGITNLVLGLLLIRRGKRTRSSALVADGKHLLTDTWSSAAMIVGLLLVWLTGEQWLDYLFALLLALMVFYTGFSLVRKSIGGLMDAADDDLLKVVVQVLRQNHRAAWIDVHNLRVKRMGSFIHLDCYLTVPYFITLQEAWELKEDLRKAFAPVWGDEYEVFIHSVPCMQQYCHACAVADCPGRLAPQTEGACQHLDRLEELRMPGGLNA
ncbi:MAG: cation transporter [Bacteroidetes bacterium]|nr:cation transporter [Bacteroidota bacterium]